MKTVPTAVDLQGLTELKQRAAHDDPKALAEASVQFEALFIGLMLKSAREASFGGGIFDNQQTQQYLELMDQQVALELARNGGFGFGKLLTDQIGSHAAAAGGVDQPAAFALPPRRLHVDRANPVPPADAAASTAAVSTAQGADSANGTP